MSLSKIITLTGALAGVVLAAIVTLAAPTKAQDYPNRTIKIVTGYPPGSGNDVPVRFIAERLSKLAGVPVIVENLQGALGNIAAESVVRAPPDGYTILMSGTNIINVYMFKNQKYDPLRDLTPLTTLFSSPFILMTSQQKTQATSVKALVDELKATKNASIGASNPVAIAAGELFKLEAKLDAALIPYKSSNDAIRELMNGQFQLMFTAASSGLRLVQSGQIRALAVTTAQRSTLLPQLPTMIESGFPDFDVNSWVAAYLPPGAPRPIVEKLNGWINQILAAEETRKFLEGVASEPMILDADKLAALQVRELANWARLAKLAKIEPQ